jgi:hypothetical protein
MAFSWETLRNLKLLRGWMPDTPQKELRENVFFLGAGILKDVYLYSVAENH